MANIGEVVTALKAGKHARRAGWNGKRMHIYMEESRHLARRTAMERREEPYLVLFTAAQTHQPGWNASTPDLLSDDWEILEPHETDYPREASSKSAMDPVWDKVDAAGKYHNSNPQDLDSSCGD